MMSNTTKPDFRSLQRTGTGGVIGAADIVTALPTRGGEGFLCPRRPTGCVPNGHQFSAMDRLQNDRCWPIASFRGDAANQSLSERSGHSANRAY